MPQVFFRQKLIQQDKLTFFILFMSLNDKKRLPLTFLWLSSTAQSGAGTCRAFSKTCVPSLSYKGNPGSRDSCWNSRNSVQERKEQSHLESEFFKAGGLTCFNETGILITRHKHALQKKTVRICVE